MADQFDEKAVEPFLAAVNEYSSGPIAAALREADRAAEIRTLEWVITEQGPMNTFPLRQIVYARIAELKKGRS